MNGGRNLMFIFSLGITVILFSIYQLLNKPIVKQTLPPYVADAPPNARCVSCYKWKFPLLISPFKDLCHFSDEQKKVDLVLVVPTRHENTQHHCLFREVYNSSQLEQHAIRVLFAFGRHPKSDDEQESRLREEAKVYGDIMQIAVNGTYRNSTLIVYNTFKWITQFCRNARFVVKTTDDVIFNVPGVLKLLDMKGDTELSDVVFGYRWHGKVPPRDRNARSYVSWKDYPYKTLPDYGSGAGTFMSFKVMADLINEAENMAFRPTMDDMAIGVNLRLTNHCVCTVPNFDFIYNANTYMQLVKRSANSTGNNCKPFQKHGPILGVHFHGVNPDGIRTFWAKRHCYEALFPNKSISTLKCKRRGQCPQNDIYPVRGIQVERETYFQRLHNWFWH